MTKKEKKKEEILRIALSEWSDKPLGERSLQLVADKCGITKQGLYRYFRNKKEIVDSLQARWQDAMILHRNQILKLSEIRPLPLDQVIEELFFFLKDNWDYIVYFFHTQTFQSPEAQKDAEDYYRLLEKTSGIACSSWVWINNSIMAIYWQYKQGGRDTAPLPEKILEKVTHGYLSSVQEKRIDRERVEIHPLGLIKEEKGVGKIDRALLDTIAEKGVSELSLRELAEQAGMGKSSLYNYFDSKESLLRSVMETLRTDFNERLRVFAEGLENSQERLYAHILFLCRYILHHPAVMVLVTELKNQMPDSGRDQEYHEKDMVVLAESFRLLKTAGTLKEDLLDYIGVMRLLSFCLGADMFLVKNGESPEDRAYRIYRLFTEGIPMNGSVINRKEV